MKLGFYYHTPVHVSDDGSIYVPSYLGLFLDSLAAEVDELICFLHTKGKDDHTNYLLKHKNVKVVSLGSDAPAYTKTFFHRRFLTRQIGEEGNKCDFIILRGPSPLTPFFRKIIAREKLVYLIVGSYKQEVKNSKVVWYKKAAISQLLLYIHRQQMKALRNARILVNSALLEEELSSVSNSIKRIYTTTLSQDDFFQRENTCLNEKIKLLFVGRIDWAKGLKELMAAFEELSKSHDTLEWHLVGWEYDQANPIRKTILDWAVKKGLEKKVFFHGKKQAGPELLSYYRESDLYLIPSYHEGFPRTIWEALASSTPVIATKVGSIPSYLTHGENAILIDPKNTTQLVEAISSLIENSELRKKLISKGLERVKEITLENQAQIIVNFVGNGKI